MEDDEARQLAKINEENVEQIVGTIALAEGWNEQRKCLYAAGLYGKQRC